MTVSKLSHKSVKKTSLRMYFTGLFVFLVVQTCLLVHHLVKIGLQALPYKKASNPPTSHVFCQFKSHKTFSQTSCIHIECNHVCKVIVGLMILGLKKLNFCYYGQQEYIPPIVHQEGCKQYTGDLLKDILEVRDLRYRPSDFVTNSYGEFQDQDTSPGP